MKRVALLLLSSGWLVPTYLAVDFFYTYMEQEVQIHVLGKEPPALPVSYLSLSHDAAKIAFVWFALVVVSWAWHFLGSKTREVSLSR